MGEDEARKQTEQTGMNYRMTIPTARGAEGL